MPSAQDHAPADRRMDDGEAERLAEVMAAFSTASRLKILFGLLGSDRTVEELAGCTGLSSSLVSQQLRVLRLHRLVVGTKDGRHVCYRLADDHVGELLAAIRAHSDHERADAGTVRSAAIAAGR